MRGCLNRKKIQTTLFRGLCKVGVKMNEHRLVARVIAARAQTGGVGMVAG